MQKQTKDTGDNNRQHTHKRDAQVVRIRIEQPNTNSYRKHSSGIVEGVARLGFWVIGTIIVAYFKIGVWLVRSSVRVTRTGYFALKVKSAMRHATDKTCAATRKLGRTELELLATRVARSRHAELAPSSRTAVRLAVKFVEAATAASECRDLTEREAARWIDAHAESLGVRFTRFEEPVREEASAEPLHDFSTVSSATVAHKSTHAPKPVIRTGGDDLDVVSSSPLPETSFREEDDELVQAEVEEFLRKQRSVADSSRFTHDGY